MYTWQQILLCGILYWLAEANLPFVTLWTLQKPLVCGWAAGMVLGAPAAGAAAGAVLSVTLLGFSSAGSSMPMDLSLAGLTGAALTAAGWSPYAAVLPALAAGAAGRYIWKLRMRVNVFFARRVRHLLEAGKTTEILLPAILFPALFALAVCLPAAAAVVRICGFLSGPGLPVGHAFPAGPGLPAGYALQAGRALSPGPGLTAGHGLQAGRALSPSPGLTVGHGLPGPALSAMIRILSSGNGILAAAAGLLPAGGIALALTAAFHGEGTGKRKAKGAVKSGPAPVDPDEDIPADPDEYILRESDMDGLMDPDDPEPERSGMPSDEGGSARGLPRRPLLTAALLWLLFIHICYNNEWMMGQVMAVTFLPLVRHLRPGDRDGQREILLRQSRYFNTHCECGACIPGLMASMEEELAACSGRGMPSGAAEEEILMVRTSLMGVCGALGDTLFQKHLIPVLLLAACLLTAGFPLQPAGPVLYAMVMTAFSFLTGCRSFFEGYRATPLKLLAALERNIFRRTEAALRILLGMLAVPAAVLFVRFPISGAGTSEPVSDLLATDLLVTDLPAAALGAGLPGCAAALILTAASVLCLWKLHWKGKRLFLLLMAAGAVLYAVGRL